MPSQQMAQPMSNTVRMSNGKFTKPVRGTFYIDTLYKQGWHFVNQEGETIAPPDWYKAPVAYVENKGAAYVQGGAKVAPAKEKRKRIRK